MREILFRGKRADTGEWIEGYYVRILEAIHHLFTGSISLNNGEAVTTNYEVLPETVGQYTGLTDKNGKKIFEGDILKGQYDEDSPEDITILVVLWDNGWRIQQDDRVPDLLEEFDCQICEVIGNIHDSPELLEGGEENAE